MSSDSMVALVSGGLDSTIMADSLPESAELLFVDYGQPYAELERRAVRRLFGGRLVEVQITGLPDLTDFFVPARNLMLSSIACRFGTRIYLGGVRDDNCVDKNADALRAMSRILEDHGAKGAEVVAPFLSTAKAEAVHVYLQFGTSQRTREERRARLLDTVSCYEPVEGSPCRDCRACLRWSVALLVNGIDVPLPSRRMIAAYLRENHAYDESRAWTLRKVVADHYKTVELSVTDEMLESPAPREIVQRYNREAAQGAFVIVSSPLWSFLRPKVEHWLKSNDIPYHEVVMNNNPWRFSGQREA